MKVVVTGEIGSGKSTVVRAAVKILGWDRPAGFFTHWGGADRGAPVLYVETWHGERGPFARRMAASATPDGLPYHLDMQSVAGIAIASLAPAAEGRSVVIDELGLIELGAVAFVEALAQLFHGPGPVLAVIQQRALERWLPLVGPGRIDRVVSVESGTRDALPGQIAALFKG